jgi:CubicO group peptidase (beta-lactamase class C family)
MGSPITLAHLAEHTSGLPRLPEGFDPADSQNPYADFDEAKLYASLQRLRLARAPGEYEYSNFGAGLLGHVLERQASLPYERLVVDRVLGPLGMADTRIDLGPDQRRRLAPPYGADLALSRNWDLAALAGAGGLRSTCRDLLVFVEANLDPPEGPLGRALERAARERKAIGGGQAVGLGWHIAGDHLTRWHDGGTGGYHSWLAIVPSLRLGVVVLANTATDRISQLGELLTRAAAGQEVKPMDLASRTEVRLDPRTLSRYVGFYALTPEFGLQVAVEGERLMVQATGQEKLPVYASGPGEFFYKVVDAQLSFLPAEGGKVDRVVLHQGGQHLEAKRTR